MPASDKLLMAIERSVEKEAERVSSSLAVAANHIFVAAALVKIAKPPDSWLMWFQDLC